MALGLIQWKGLGIWIQGVCIVKTALLGHSGFWNHCVGCLLFNSTATYNWEEANNYCQFEANGSLIEIINEEQLAFVQMELWVLADHEGDHYWWTSGTDLGREGRWYWASSLTPVGSFIWYTNEPGSPKSNCLYLEYAWGWEGGDVPCDYKSNIYPICQTVD